MRQFYRSELVFQSESDDCFRCCIATMLRLPSEAVPNFFEGLKQGVPVPTVTMAYMSSWFKAKELYLVEVPMSADTVEEVLAMLGALHPDLNVIVSGKSPRGKDHAVIARDGHIVHDPSRDGGGIIGPCYTGLFYAAYIARYT